jgi:hypothetical protein
MKILRALALLSPLALFACGGGPSPASLCNHLYDLAEKAGGKEAEEADKNKEECLKEVEKVKEDLGDDAFKKFGECVTAKESLEAAVRGCNPDSFKEKDK